MEHKISENYGLVFAGGGAKGAWQIGVLKALMKEKVCDRPASIVAGTSVGALNAVLYSLDPKNIERAEYIWKEAIQKNPIIMPELPDNFGKLFVLADLFKCFAVDLVLQSKKIAHCSNENLRTVICEGIRNSVFHVPVSVCAYDLDNQKPHYQVIDTNDKKISDWLLASTAIPYIFPSITIDKTRYTDGGFGWDHPIRLRTKSLTKMRNVPLEPIRNFNANTPAEQKIQTVILLALSQNEETFWDQNNDQFKIFPIMPSEPLGDPLDFSAEHINKLLQQGFEDGENWINGLKKVVDNSIFINAFHKQSKKIDEYKSRWDEIKENSNALLKRYSDNFDKLLDDFNNDPSQEKRLNICENILLKYSDDDINRLKENIIESVFDAYEEIWRFLDQDKNSFDDEYVFCIENSARLISLAESVGKHEEASQMKDLLAWTRHTKMISDLPTEKRETIKSFVMLIRNILGISAENEREHAKMKLELLDHSIEHQVKEISEAIKNARARFKALFSTAVSPLDMLEKPTEFFVGRENELKEIEISLSNEKAVLLGGFFGNGKTQVALKYAALHGNQFLGGKYYIDAKGKNSFEEIFASLLENQKFCEYWSVDKKPQSVADCAELVCDRLKASQDIGKTLLLIVNINEPMAILSPDKINKYKKDSELLSIIVTSNDILPEKIVKNWQLNQIHIAPMPVEDGLELLDRYCPSANETIKRHMYEITRGNAFALSMAGKLFLERLEILDDTNSEDYLRELKDKNVERIVIKNYLERYLKPAYNNCTSIQREILKYTAVFPADNICSAWICNLLEKKDPDCNAKFYLRKLIQTNGLLSNKNSGEPSFCVIIPKIQEMILRLESPEEIRQHAEELCRHIVKNEYTSHSFSMEETVLLANAFCIWSKAEWKDCILPLLFSLDLSDDLGDYLTEYQLYPLREKVCQAAENVLNSMPDSELKQKNRASGLIYRGHIEFDHDNYDKALKCYQEAHRIRQEIFRSSEETFLPLEYQGTVYGRMKNMTMAENIFMECEKKFIQYAENAGQNDRRTAMETLARLYKRWADAFYENKDMEAAEKYYKKAVDSAAHGVSAAEDTPGGVVSILHGRFERNLGVFYMKEERREEAVHCLRRSNEILCKTDQLHNDIKRNNEDLNALYSWFRSHGKDIPTEK